MEFHMKGIGMKRVFGALLIMLVCSLNACKDDPVTAGGNAAIDSKLAVQMQEQLGTVRTLVLHVTTERVYDCGNFTITGEPVIDGSRITIPFENIYEPNECSGSRAAARADVDLGTLPSAAYDLAIIVNQDTALAQLLVTDSSYVLANGEHRWTTFPRTVLLKVPVDAIWGDGEYNDPNSNSILGSFRDSLKAMGAEEFVFPAGDYGFFTVNGAGEIDIPLAAGHPNYVRPFIYRYGGDLLVLRSLVKRFGKSFHDPLDISLYGPRGQVYQSGVLAGEP
jgi:hypothetical protein